MHSDTPILDAHRLRLARTFAEFVSQLGDQLLVIGPGDGVTMQALRGRGRSVRGVDNRPDRVEACVAAGLEVVEGDPCALPDEDRSIDVVVLRDVLSTAEDPEAVAREAWRVARTCVVLAESEYTAGLTSQAMAEWLDALVDEVRFSRGIPAVHPLDADEMLGLLPETPDVVETRSFGLLTRVPAEEVDAIVADAVATGSATSAQKAQAAALREDAAKGEVTLPGIRALVAFRGAPPVDAASDQVASARGEVTLRTLELDDVPAMLRLHPAPSQQRFVAPNVASLAQAALAPHVWYRAIAVGGTPVGFAMLDVDPARSDAPFLWRFMVDARQQRRGVGRRALELVCEHFAAEGAGALHTSVVEGPGSPRPFYESVGFEATGAIEDGETVLRRALEQRAAQNA
ncbi:MAG: class I SAM-dependent methyltransferase [Planctomycetota bacterium]